MKILIIFVLLILIGCPSKHLANLIAKNKKSYPIKSITDSEVNNDPVIKDSIEALGNNSIEQKGCPSIPTNEIKHSLINRFLNSFSSRERYVVNKSMKCVNTLRKNASYMDSVYSNCGVSAFNRLYNFRKKIYIQKNWLYHAAKKSTASGFVNGNTITLKSGNMTTSGMTNILLHEMIHLAGFGDDTDTNKDSYETYCVGRLAGSYAERLCK